MEINKTNVIILLIVLLPYEIGLLLMPFYDITLGQVVGCGFMIHLLLIALSFIFRYPLSFVIALVITLTQD